MTLRTAVCGLAGLALALACWCGPAAWAAVSTMPDLKPLSEPNVFAARKYVPKPLPTFAASRDRLPQPIVDDHPEWVKLYWKAWQLAFSHLKQPAPGSGFVSNFIDPAFNQNTFVWDSCFMVMFANYADPVFHAIGTLNNFYAKQHPDGFIMREITRATGKDFHFGSPKDWVNPPLFSWVEWQSYQMTGDRSRFREVLPVLVKQYRWLQENRRRPDGFYWNTGLGSGLDDLKRGPAYDWLDMTCQMALNAYYIARIAESVGDEATADYFRGENRRLGQMVNANMWDPATGFYYDLTAQGKPTGVKTVLGFWPLLARLATKKQAESLTLWLRDATAFWRPDMVPALAADEPGYTPDGQYWNGAVWAPTNYMVVKGLQAYGYEKLASQVTARYLANMAKVLQDTGTIFENYAPEKPVGHGVRDMVGWSGDGPIALLIENILGMRGDAAESQVYWRPRLPGRNGVRELTVGGAHLSLVAGPLNGDRRTLTMTTDRPFTVVVDRGFGPPVSYHLQPGTTTATARFRVGETLRVKAIE